MLCKKRIQLYTIINTIFLPSSASFAQHSHTSVTKDRTQAESFGEFFHNLFGSEFMPHGHCYFWRPDLTWLHVLSDGIIALSYFTIPAMLFYFIKKKKDVPFNWIFLLFASFIFWCGLTHVLGIWTLWDPIYRLEGLVKAITAGVSFVTAILIYPLIPKALALKTPAELEALNRKLNLENQKRKEIEMKLKEVNQSLEKRVEAKTHQLKEKAFQLAQSNADLEQFAYVASHDLQEPLRMISSYCQLIQTQSKQGEITQEDTDQYLAFAIDGAKRMKGLIDDLLEFSRIGRQDIQSYETFASEEVLQMAKQNLKTQIEETQADIQHDPLPVIHAQKAAIIRLFQNLLSNAMKYSSKDKVPKIHITAKKIQSGYWQFSFSDNGIGIEKEHFERIFVIFQRLHPYTEYPGTGMGLAICKKIVESHYGKIWLDSEKLKGSTFYFTLPEKTKSKGDS